jgi:uroporphyrinogen-III decarboxylase
MDTGVDRRIRAAESLVQAKREPEREAHLIRFASRFKQTRYRPSWTIRGRSFPAIHTWTAAKGEQKEMEAHSPSLDQLCKNAAECIRLAEEARTSAHKSFFIEMAERWVGLAEKTRDR